MKFFKLSEKTLPTLLLSSMIQRSSNIFHLLLMAQAFSRGKRVLQILGHPLSEITGHGPC